MENSGEDSLAILDQKAKQKKKTCYIVGGGLLLVIVVLAIVLPLTLKKSGGDTPSNPPDPYTYQEYNPFSVDQKTVVVKDTEVDAVIELKTPNQAKYSQLVADEKVSGSEVYKPVNPADIPVSKGNNAQNYKVNLKVQNVLANSANVTQVILKGNDTNDSALPESVFMRPAAGSNNLTNVGFQLNTSPFSIEFKDMMNENETLATTKMRKLEVQEKFSEIGFTLPNDRCFGLGPTNRKLKLEAGVFNLWSRPQQMGVDEGLGGMNGGHNHPMIVCQGAHGQFFSMFFVSQAAQSFEIVKFDGYQEIVLNYITLSSHIEFYMNQASTVEQLFDNYFAMINPKKSSSSPAPLPPYHSFGWFQGSNSYMDQATVQNVVEMYKDAGLPLEGIIMDSSNYQDQDYKMPWFLNRSAFPDMLNWNYGVLKQAHQKLLVSIDSMAIESSIKNVFYKQAQQLDILLKNETGNGEYSKINSTFPDFFNNQTTQQIQLGFTTLPFYIGNIDGMIIRGNQLSTPQAQAAPSSVQSEKKQRRFLTSVANEEEVGNYAPYGMFDSANQSTYLLPFVPGFKQTGFLDNETISLNATHTGNVSEFVLHNYNGHMSLKTYTESWIASQNKDIPKPTAYANFPLMLSESTMPGSGQFGGAVLGSQMASWENLQNTVSQVMKMSMFGVNQVMVDACGAFNSTGAMLDEELCARGMQLGAFMPMVKNYFDKSAPSNEVFNFKSFEYKMMASKAMKQRQELSRYIYTQVVRSQRVAFIADDLKTPLVSPLIFYFPMDNGTFENTESTFMFGDALKVSPCLQAGNNSFESYFPSGTWVNLYNRSDIMNSTGMNQMIMPTSLFTTVHQKEGSIIPFQQNTALAKTTYSMYKDVKTTLLVLRTDRESKKSMGSLFLGDLGDQSGLNHTNYKLEHRYNSYSHQITVQPSNPNNNFTIDSSIKANQLEEIVMLASNDLMGTNFACYRTGLNRHNMTIDYNPSTMELRLKPKVDDLAFTSFSPYAIVFGDSTKGDVNLCY